MGPNAERGPDGGLAFGNSLPARPAEGDQFPTPPPDAPPAATFFGAGIVPGAGLVTGSDPVGKVEGRIPRSSRVRPTFTGSLGRFGGVGETAPGRDEGGSGAFFSGRTPTPGLLVEKTGC